MSIKTVSIRHLILFLAIVCVSCGRNSGQFPEGNDIFGLASAITLAGNETEIMLHDFFHSNSLSRIDSVSVHPSLRARLSDNRVHLHLQARSLNVPAISELTVWLDGTPYSLILRRSARIEHTFRFYQGEKRFRHVAVRGQMTDWMPEPMTLVDGVWQLTMRLNPGRYEYLIVTDGQDIIDPENPMKVSNNAGAYNSLVEVGDLDCSDAPRIVPVRHRRNTIDLELINDPEQVIALWQNFRIPQKNLRQQENKLTINIPRDARKVKRSFIRIKAARGSKMSNDLLIPLEFGKPVTDPALLSREDREATIMYFLMVDHFRNGNMDHNDPVDDPQVAPRASFYGGDLDGVLEKIQNDYFNLDGFRHDATKRVPLEFWRALTKKIKEDKMFPENKRLFQIGETFGSHELISCYVGSGMLDGKFDFNTLLAKDYLYAYDSFARFYHSLPYTITKTNH